MSALPLAAVQCKNTMTKTVHCPNCDKLVTWNAESKWKPFCSERCKLIDLGDWASENHRIAGPATLPDQNESEDFNPSDYH